MIDAPSRLRVIRKAAALAKIVYYESIKRKLKTKYIWGVGVMKDYNLTLRNLLKLNCPVQGLFFFEGTLNHFKKNPVNTCRKKPNVRLKIHEKSVWTDD